MSFVRARPWATSWVLALGLAAACGDSTAATDETTGGESSTTIAAASSSGLADGTSSTSGSTAADDSSSSSGGSSSSATTTSGSDSSSGGTTASSSSESSSSSTTGTDTGTDTGDPPGQGDCCSNTIGVPGCTDAPIERCVCAVDAFCCDIEWDTLCVEIAEGACKAVCRSSGRAPCCEVHTDAGCDDATCETDVCTIDGFCCDAGWDQICADEAAGICAICGADGGDCCTAHPRTQGCGDAVCVESICGASGSNPECCTEGWSQACADLADDCAVCLGGGTGPVTTGSGGT